MNLYKLLDQNLIPYSSGLQKITYLKLKADYNVLYNDVQPILDIQSIVSDYEMAWNLSYSLLCPTHPLRLNVAYLLSNYYYFKLRDINKAIDLAKLSINEGIDKLSSLELNDYKESSLSMQLIYYDLKAWESKQ
eukprot:NODE_9173_length_615_cov_18.426829_g8542_i0.p1 GENE.NODE_9173_length_615_cov_18.426829_g8542_i0~~NODE_9173_length_615_cov_18.426829_g8542_i0.p1  ORF type:complete len:134 (-),score=17.61 NODE_9173_length_615_cov_18.426829_g8542_i0:145-546(-)